MTQPLNIWDFGWPIIAVIGAVVVYLIVVRPQLAAARRVLGKAELVESAEGWLSWAVAKLTTIKTVILAGLAGIPQALQLIDPNTLFDLQQLPWGEIFDPKVANWVTLICSILIPVTHSLGLHHAARTEPQAEDE